MSNSTSPGSKRRNRIRAAARPKKSSGASAEDHSAAIARIDTLTRSARTSWFGLISFLAFVGVTLMGVEDADFFIPARQTELPLIGVSIPTFLFFVVAPFIGLMLYAYLHLHLLKLWEALTDVPAQIDDRPLSDHIAPWLVSDFALARRPECALRKRPLRLLADLAILVLVFLSGLGILAWFWWRSIPAHAEGLTVFACGVPLALSIYVGAKSWGRMLSLTTGIGDIRRFRMPWSGIVLTLSLAVASVFGWFKTEGTFDHFARTWFDMSDELIAAAWWFEPSVADLRFVEFVPNPPDWKNRDQSRKAFRVLWCKENGLAPHICGPVPKESDSPPLFQADQRLLWCKIKFPNATDDLQTTCDDQFVLFDKQFDADWSAARIAEIAALPDFKFIRNDLRNAILVGARLQGADLWDAKIDDDTSLNPAALRGAGLREVYFTNIINPELLAEAFGDASVTLPDGMAAGQGDLNHWSPEILNAREFNRQWQAFQKSINYDPE